MISRRRRRRCSSGARRRGVGGRRDRGRGGALAGRRGDLAQRGDVAGARLWARQVEMWWARQAARTGRCPSGRRPRHEREGVPGGGRRGSGDHGDAPRAGDLRSRLRRTRRRRRGHFADLANIHTRRGSHAAAHAEYQRALAIHARVHGPHSTYAADTLYNLGSLAETLESTRIGRVSLPAGAGCVRRRRTGAITSMSVTRGRGSAGWSFRGEISQRPSAASPGRWRSRRSIARSGSRCGSSRSPASGEVCN